MTARDEVLRHAFAVGLEQRGWLPPRWRAAFGSVPRHAFLPRFFRLTADGGRYEALDAGDPGALELIYTNSVLPTQLDGDDGRWEYARQHGPVAGVPTCSSTQPSLMATMLDALDVGDSDRVLEIGAGTGYNAALLSHLLGSTQVTTVDIDTVLVERARKALASAGYTPTVAAVDGAGGYLAGAPYDRLIATCAVPDIPAPWLVQVRPGGVVLTNLDRDLGGGLLLRLTVDEHGGAGGHLLDDYGSFMPLRALPAAQTAALVRAASTATGDTHTTELPPLADDGPPWMALAALMLPGVARLDLGRPDGDVQWLVHSGGSWAYYQTPKGTVEQGGPRQLWTEIEHLHQQWVEHGSPDRTHIGVTITPSDQWVWLNNPSETVF